MQAGFLAIFSTTVVVFSTLLDVALHGVVCISWCSMCHQHWQQTNTVIPWAFCREAAGWELNDTDHLCALWAAVWRLALACCWATQSVPPPGSHTTALKYHCSHSHIATQLHIHPHKLALIPKGTKQVICIRDVKGSTFGIYGATTVLP
jgi:hypothetical protein